MLLSSAHPYHQSSSESGDSLSDSFLDTDASGTHSEKGLKAGDFSFGLGHSPYISALDQDHIFPFEQRNESIMREIFLSSQAQDEHDHLPNVNYFRPELHPPSQFRSKSLHSGDMQHISRLNHHTHTTLPSLPQLITANLDSAVDTSMLMSSNMGHAPEPNSATTSSSTESTHRQSEPWSDSARESQNDHIPRARKPRREKPRIELAPDQPPTTQGKPRSRVYVACVQCRTRKIRCDGAKPTCHNCSRRSTNGGATCSYDSAPKRRGPDKTPGARQRTARDTNQEGDANIGTVRRRRRKPETASPSKNDVRNTSRTYATDSCERQSPTDMPSPVSSIPLTPISPLSDEPSKTWNSLVPARGFGALSRTRPTLDNAEQPISRLRGAFLSIHWRLDSWIYGS
ncbi:hypothetical protein PILCRDRAFT_212993 [Piloderma croceum F 1598]|uniref:Zn(2)-C6 fungal-type domain-containing protein n=1 Tax=Piloderma croceum (strain F 1598) TaxID=765440 RepID=A0A0C3GBP6_PILCF|nr:hypothetical protein PILCRDRAFT_212993 [Piloderma croceum F 1598]